MSGETESKNTEAPKTIDERYTHIENLLKQYEEGLGLPKNFKISTAEVMGYLQMTRDELKALTEEACSEISFALAQCAFFIRTQLNAERAKSNWAEQQIRGLIAPVVGEYKGYSFDERKIKAISDNSACMTLNRIKINAQVRVDRLDGLADQIQFMSKALNDLKFTKRSTN
jgi:hypothetical protein